MIKVGKIEVSREQFLYVHGNFLYYVNKRGRIDKTRLEIDDVIGNFRELISDKIKTVLVVVNPVGGPGNARTTWKSLRPHFERRYKICAEIFTERIAHAYEIVEQKISALETTPDAVVCLGGDGLLSEVFNALYDARKLHIPVFPIPCGSGNGLVTSALAAAGQPATFTAAVRAALHGRTQPLDLFQVEVGNEKLVAFLSVTMGLMADTDIDSECFRFCGSSRFTVCGLWKIARLKKYHAQVKLVDSETGQEQEISGNFTNVSVFSLTHASPDFVAAPDRALNDGRLSAVCLLRSDASRLDLVRAMSAAETGKQSLVCPWWRATTVKAFEISHLGPSDGFVVDGELYAGKTLKASVIPDAVALIYAP